MSDFEIWHDSDVDRLHVALFRTVSVWRVCVIGDGAPSRVLVDEAGGD